MSRFVYLICEGVLDVVLVTQVLCKVFDFDLVEKKSDLSEKPAEWLGLFKWPHSDDIARRAVPAPAFLTKDSLIVGIRNSQGLERIKNTIYQDQEAFMRLDWSPDAFGVILDADDEPCEKRFASFATALDERGLPRPVEIEKVVSKDGVAAGIFSFPGSYAEGTLEDLLLLLGKERFPELYRHAEAFVNDWTEDTSDFRELKKPSGRKKSKVSAMISLLKPAKPIAASIEDQKWLGENPGENEHLKPLVEFLRAVLN